MPSTAELLPLAGITIAVFYWIGTRRSRVLTLDNLLTWLHPHQLEGLDELLELPESTMHPSAFLVRSHGWRRLHLRLSNAYRMVKICAFAREHGLVTLQDHVNVREDAWRVFTSSGMFALELLLGSLSSSFVGAHGLISVQAYWRISRVMYQITSELLDQTELHPYF